MIEHVKRKYVKTKSLTWWVSLAPLATGVFMALEPVHGLADWVQAARNATGLSAPVLVQIGLAGIGLRGAIND